MKHVLFYAISLALAVSVIAALPLDGETELYGDVIRLHVLAASDGEDDQADKLAVRDAILETYSSRLTCTEESEAAAAVTTLLPDIQKTAEDTLRARGKEEEVDVFFTDETYPTRTYGSLTFPAGTYHSLRVVIGAGEGKNWWCVLFPPLCLGAATADSVITEKPAALNDGAWRIVSRNGEYEVRFRTLEWFASN